MSVLNFKKDVERRGRPEPHRGKIDWEKLAIDLSRRLEHQSHGRVTTAKLRDLTEVRKEEVRILMRHFESKYSRRH